MINHLTKKEHHNCSFNNHICIENVNSKNIENLNNKIDDLNDKLELMNFYLMKYFQQKI